MVLCFFGRRSLHLAVLVSGFALGWLLADTLDASPLTASLVALAAALGCWAVVTFVFRSALFFVGALTGGVIGLKLYGLLEPGEKNVLLAIIVVLALACLGGLATQRFRTQMLAVMCALGGAALTMSGTARIAPSVLDFLHTPQTTAQTVLAGVVWLALTVAGWTVQRNQSRKPESANQT
ncbi:MAG: hypothetical protein WBA97_28095 [Actinophytocola sp.]|uniref:hypothetical protein n=1 Tax=Actinophytocola sp. TaxID=1872138 RepID=UPI003C7345DD